jgi:hypothetical protein
VLNPIDHLNWSPVPKWFVTRLGSKDKYRKAMQFKKDQITCSKYQLTILDSIVLNTTEASLHNHFTIPALFDSKKNHYRQKNLHTTLTDAKKNSETPSGESITIFVNLELFRHFETVTKIRTWIESHKYWRML